MPPRRSNTPAIDSMGQITTCISRDFDYFIRHIIQIWSKRARAGISDHHKSACKYTSIQRIQTKFSQYIHLNTSFILLMYNSMGVILENIK